MTTETQDMFSDAWQANDTVDFSKYLDIVLAWWKEIFVITGSCVLLAVIGILSMRAILPPQFHASADVAIVRTISNVNFDERFQTTSEEVGTNAANLSARRSALLGLVTSGSIAREVIAQLSDVLTAEEQVPANLLEMVQGEEAGGTQNDSDLIRITVTADDPDKAAVIATTWAKIFVHNVNTIYGQVPDEVFNSIEEELAQARQNYLDSQTRLETFIVQNKIDELNSLVSILQQRITQEVSLQQAYLLQWQQVQEQLATAKSLQVQLEQGGDGTARSTMAALQVLKISVYGQPPTGLQVEVRDIPDVPTAMMLADVKGLIQALETQRQELDTQISAGSDRLSLQSEESPSAVSETLQALRQAKSELEAETSRQLQLVQQRDLYWETYKTLSSKRAELDLTRAAASSEVRLGGEAVPPATYEPRIRLLVGIVGAAASGFVVALFVVFLSSYLDYHPFLTRRHGTLS